MIVHSMLAVRSDFSIGESILDIDRIIAEAKRVGAKAVAVTDTMTISAVIDLTTKAKKAGIKPIIGCRLRLVDDPTWKKPKGQKVKKPPFYFMTAYVLSEKGLQCLFRLLTLANSEERFYEVPRLGFADLFAALDTVSADDVALASSDVYSVFHHKQASEILTQAIARLSASNVFATLTPINTPLYDTLNFRAIEAAEALGIPTLVTFPAFYEPGQADAQNVMMAIGGKQKMASIWAWKPSPRDLHARTDKELADLVIKACVRLQKRRPGLAALVSYFRAGLANTEVLVAMVKFEWAKHPISLPKMAPDEDAALVDWCRLGWAARFAGGRRSFGHAPTAIDLKAIYLPRLQFELKVLRDLKFATYFLLVQDIVKWSKENGIAVGPGRGSVGGSLVAYLMGITEVDPIRFGLLFERFINPGRLDLPDADLDFMSSRRQDVIDYITAKHGADRVAGISNYGALAAASTIRDVGRVFDLSDDEVKCSKFVEKQHGQHIELHKMVAVGTKEAPNPHYVPEIVKFSQEWPQLWPIMLRLEGVMRNLGKHAGGVVVAGVPLVERGSIERREGEATLNWDMRVAESMGLVKMDILGLSTLDVLTIAQRYVFERRGVKIDLHDIPLDDADVLAAFAQGKTTGVFQFESGGMRRLLKDLGADGTISFEDVTAATALYRPGPMDSGMLTQYVARKRGFEPVEYDHPNMKAALEATYGVAVYQEQVMRLARDVAGFTMQEADNLRKAMGKKDRDKMAAIREAFVKGAVATSAVTDGWAGALFDKIEAFAGYGFNRSHAVEYTLISYQAMWLKVKHPVEFFAAALTVADDEQKMENLVGDAQSRDIEILPPDINHSTDRFEILTDTKLCIPFQKLKGISANTTGAILAARATGPFASKDDFLARVEKRKCNIKHQSVLDGVGAFASIEPSQLPPRHIDRLPAQREFLPGLIIDTVRVARSIVIDKFVREKLSEVVNRCRDENTEDGLVVKPTCGKAPKFMVVFDAPTWSEEKEGALATGNNFADYVGPALYDAGLTRADCYWTALIKRPKADKQISAAELKRYLPYFEAELALVKPPLILCLGSTVARYFVPELKGKIDEHAGRVVYRKDLDANILVGFNPGMIYHDADKREVLSALFQMAANITS